jgi:hypothetical protein
MPRAFVAAAALALFASACTDTPTVAPAARAPGERASLSASASGPTLIPNSVKYRDTGGKPAKGRSGSAELEAMAVLDREGVTTVNYFTRHATEWWREGTLSRLQLKASAPDGQPKFTRNLDDTDLSSWGPVGSGRLQVRGLSGGDQLRLQANVTGLDPHRTDVVTVTETVKRLPDLTVRMTAPAQAETNTFVNILAVAQERNGDMGTWATCELYVGSKRADYVWSVWVDAGDAVTCALTVRFGMPGTYPLEARVRVSGREWDTSNNTDRATIQVHGDSPRYYATAEFEEATQLYKSVYSDSWQNLADGSGSEYRGELSGESRDRTAYFSAYTPAQLMGPVDVQMSMSTGGRVVDSMRWSSPGPNQQHWCESNSEGPAMLWVCTWGGIAGFTQVTYSLMTGSATYHSVEYMRAWDGLGGTDLVYHRNDSYTYGDTVTVGDDWTFNLRLNEHDISRTVPLTRSGPFGYSEGGCDTWEDLELGYINTHCGEYSYSVTFLSGYAAD